LPHYDEELADYDWYKYDRDTYVTQLENYRPNYFVSKQPYKTKLSLFKYDFKTNEQLTTYEPKRIFEMNDENTKSYQPKHQDLFTLLLLQSHRIKIDRSADHVNVSCLADFLIDQASMSESSLTLMHQIRDLAMFNFNLNDEMRKYYQPKSVKQSWNKNHMLNYKKANQVGYGKQTAELWFNSNFNSVKLARRKKMRKERSLFFYETSDVMSSPFYDYGVPNEKPSKNFYTVRLIVGPVRIEEPYEQSLVSCDLDLINSDDVNLDHRSRVFKYLFKEDIGIDKDEQDRANNVDGFVLVSELSEEYDGKSVKPADYADDPQWLETTVPTAEDLAANVTGVPEISLVNFIPRFTVDNMNETLLEEETEASTESLVQPFFSRNTQEEERVRKPTLLFLLDNQKDDSSSRGYSFLINLNVYFITAILSSFFYLI
jgi:hypothetical protein